MQTTFTKHQEELLTIKSLFEKTITLRDRPAKTLLQQCRKRNYICVGLVTAFVNAEAYILLIRKKNNLTEEAYGFYLAPGGFKNQAEDYKIGLQRELIEETNLKVHPEQIFEIFTYQKVNDYENEKIFKEIKFFHVNLGNVSELPDIVARSDVGEAKFIKWSDVIKIVLTDSINAPLFSKISY